MEICAHAHIHTCIDGTEETSTMETVEKRKQSHKSTIIRSTYGCFYWQKQNRGCLDPDQEPISSAHGWFENSHIFPVGLCSLQFSFQSKQPLVKSFTWWISDLFCSTATFATYSAFTLKSMSRDKWEQHFGINATMRNGGVGWIGSAGPYRSKYCFRGSCLRRSFLPLGIIAWWPRQKRHI